MKTKFFFSITKGRYKDTVNSKRQNKADTKIYLNEEC